MVFIKLSKSLYDFVVSYGYSTAEKVLKAQKYADEKKCNPNKALIDTAVITEENLLELQGKIYNYKIIKNIKEIEVDTELIQKFDNEKLIKLKMLPFDNKCKFKVMLTNPANSIVIEDYIKEVIGKNIQIDYFLISESVFLKYINSDSANNGVIEYDLDELQISDQQDSQIYDVTNVDASTIVTLANKIFYKAARMKCSDVHIEPSEDKMRVRFRIDGILHDILETPKQVHKQLINRIKTMANMDINNSRIAQGGAIRLKIYGSHIDMRVSTLPTVYGEKMVLRLLDKNSVNFNISMINFSVLNERKFRNCILKPSGIILITGPTGSGKSSSLYAAVSELNKEELCIVTIEDPVEYRIQGIVQIQVSPAIGMTFSVCLREVLRQDPDIILIGEIRDKETATTAIQASNTGHLLFSTLHTNDAVSAIVRLIEMGIESFMVSSTLNGVVSQRLVRRICENCKIEYPLEKSSPYRNVLNCGNDEVFLNKGKGCSECNHTGYKGRIAIQEFLVVDDHIRMEISNGGTASTLQKVAIENGMKTIFEDGIEKALAGLTTLEEVHRILHFDI